MYMCNILKVIAKKKNCEASNSPRKYGGKKKSIQNNWAVKKSKRNQRKGRSLP